MNQKQTIVYVSIGIIVFSLLSFTSLINAHTVLKKMNTYNPLVHSDATKRFVYSKPVQQNKGVIYDLYAIINVVNAPRGEYELIVKSDHGGAKSLRTRFQRHGGIILLLQQGFNFVYTGNTEKDGHDFNIYKLVRINDAITKTFANVNIGKLTHFHVACF